MVKKEAQDSIDWGNTEKYLNKTYILVNVLANFCGALFVNLYFAYFDNISFLAESPLDAYKFPVVMFLFLVMIGMMFRKRWFKDVDRFIKFKSQQKIIDPGLLKSAQKKILNLPFISSMVSMFNWGLAAVIMSSMILMQAAPSNLSFEINFYILRVFMGIIMAGIATSALVFFLMENYCRKIIPYFFPSGGLSKVKGVFSLSLRSRIMITFVFASFIPIIDLAMLSYSTIQEAIGSDPESVLSGFGYLLLLVLFVDLSLAIILSHLLSKTIVKPVTEMKNAMERVEKGDLTACVKVSDSNELGILADNFNKMTEGLRDRYLIRQSLALARDVQQDLLPGKEPVLKELDIAGRIIYSDETGGDYYDYIYPTNPDDKKIGIVIGDVSEHGISSALLMASTRAFMRQRAALPGSIADTVTDVNIQFSRDVENSGRFMTLFFLSVEYGKNSLEWIRAGHEPAIFYDSLTDSFDELKGKGIALGIDGDFQYSRYEKKQFDKGKIVILATDGLWEAMNKQGEMYGKERIYKVIQRNYNLSAKKMIDSIMDSVEDFTGSKTPEDDMTMVIIKTRQEI